MTIGHIPNNRRPFRPTGKGGGSKPGKPYGVWPLVLRVIAHAIVERAKGDRGKGRAPLLTRANDSRELWSLKVPIGSPLYTMHQNIVQGKIMVVKDWKKHL